MYNLLLNWFEELFFGYCHSIKEPKITEEHSYIINLYDDLDEYTYTFLAKKRKEIF